MNKLVFNFKSKESKKIKNPKILLGGKEQIFQKWEK